MDAQLNGERLHWRFAHGSAREFVPPKSRRDLLTEFVALERAPDAQVLLFAKRYGPLNLCGHGEPRWHDRVARLKGKYFSLAGPCEKDLPGGGELLSWWREWAGQFGAVLRVAYAIHSASTTAGRDELGSVQDWRIMYKRLVVVPSRWKGPQTREEARTLFAWGLNEWIGKNLPACPSWFAIEWSAAEPRILMGGGSLFVTLNGQLVFAACSVDGLAICSACGGPYIPSGRRPARGRRRYCPGCHEAGAPIRDAQRACRLRKALRKGRGRRGGR